MAWAAQFARGATTQNITISDEFALPQIKQDVTIIGGDGGAKPRVIRKRTGEPVVWTIPIYLSNSSHANLKSDMDTIDAFLQGGECTLSITASGSSTATIWDVYHADPVQLYSSTADLKYWVRGSITLLVSPFARSAAADLYTAESKATPTYLSLSSLAGTYRTPLTHTVTSNTADDLHSCYLALAPANSGYIFQAEDLTWSAGADFADTSASGGNATKFASTSYCTANIDTKSLEEGPYLVIARVKMNGSATGTIKTDITSGRGEPDTTWTRTTWHIVEIGECILPAVKTRSSTAANLVVSVKSSSATAGQEACLDYVYLIPKGRGFWSWHHGTDANGCTTVYHDAATGITYVDNVADGQYVTGNTLMALSSEYLLIITENPAGDAATQTVLVTLNYEARYGWMR